LNFYKTSEIARETGVHPNTVRFYEDWGLLPPVPRAGNRYRLYTQVHLEQMRLARIAIRSAFAIGTIRKRAISIIKTAAASNLDQALEESYDYLTHLNSEKEKAEEALGILRKWMNKRDEADTTGISLGRRDTAALLEVSMDTLRNWERNGLLDIPRNSKNGYRIYGKKEIDRAKVIRTLRLVNYSIMAILRMLKATDSDTEDPDVLSIVRTPQLDEDMVYATDRWILSLTKMIKDANKVIIQIQKMMKKQVQEIH